MPTSAPPTAGWRRCLPAIGTPGYHVMLSVVAILILGPLGGISAAFMNFSIGFFLGGQVLAGILGSTVTFPYGPEGKHGANYIQTMAASVSGMAGMAVLVQAMAWLGLPEPAPWKLVLYFTSIGMFGVGVGMLYTPILVDRMRLAYPSGYAVANILRALTDPRLLRRSIAKLGGGMLTGIVGGVVSLKPDWLGLLGLGARGIAMVDGWGISASTFGAGMIVGARLTVSALLVALIGDWLKPYLIGIGWLNPGDPFRKIGFIIALGTILGAALIDVALILVQAVRRLLEKQTSPAEPPADWKRVNLWRLVFWVAFWGVAVVVVGADVLRQPVGFVALAVVLTFLFVLVNGIAQGISDSNPLSSAFVLTVFLMAALGLRDPGVGLMCAGILLVTCSAGGDMQQDRSTGWRLGTNRVVQFRYQIVGIAMGAVLCVVLARVFMSAYPVLRADQFSNPHLPEAERWQSAMTYKFVGALKGITHAQPQVMHALALGVGIGLATELLRKLVKIWKAYQNFGAASRTGRTIEFIVDALIIPSPYASSFGGFVELATMYWWVAGGVVGTLYDGWERKQARGLAGAMAGGAELPTDMNTTSLFGGGLIAGESLAALTLGIISLCATVF